MVLELIPLFSFFFQLDLCNEKKSNFISDLQGNEYLHTQNDTVYNLSVISINDDGLSNQLGQYLTLK